MGLPIKHRKKYSSHKQRWDKQTIVEEKELMTSYALKNKKDIRKAQFLVDKFKRLAKIYNRSEDTKASEQAQHFMDSLKAKGFLKQDATSLDDVLDITARDVLERRLSNIVYKLKFARSPAQARQFVVHRHVRIAGKVVDSPSYLVPLDQEKTLEFRETSNLASEEHPERKLADEGLVVEESKEYELNENQQIDEEGKSPSDRKEEELDDEEVEEKVE